MLDHLDGRRLEVTADGFRREEEVSNWPLTQLWCPHCVETTCQGEARVALEEEARSRKERTYPEVVRAGGPDLWCSTEKLGADGLRRQVFLCALAKVKSRSAPSLLKGKVRCTWLHRWHRLLACTAAKSLCFIPARFGNLSRTCSSDSRHDLRWGSTGW